MNIVTGVIQYTIYSLYRVNDIDILAGILHQVYELRKKDCIIIIIKNPVESIFLLYPTLDLLFDIPGTRDKYNF